MRVNTAPRTEFYDRSWMTKARLLLGMTQGQIARTVNISQGFYNKIEQGISTPNVHLGMEISRALGVSPDIWLSEKRIA